MFQFVDQQYLLNDQYKDASHLKQRLHIWQQLGLDPREWYGAFLLLNREVRRGGADTSIREKRGRAGVGAPWSFDTDRVWALCGICRPLLKSCVYADLANL